MFGGKIMYDSKVIFQIVTNTCALILTMASQLLKSMEWLIVKLNFQEQNMAFA